jgi:hypothetical protein
MSRLVLQPRISKERFKIWVAVVMGVAIGGTEGVVVGVGVVVDVVVKV